MKHSVFILIIITFLFAIGCDRYSTNYKADIPPADNLEEFVKSFQEIINNFSTNPQIIENLLAEDYGYDEYDRTGLLEFINNLNSREKGLTARIINYSHNYFNWSIFDGSTEYSFYDYVKKQNDNSYKLTGNQSKKQNGLITLFTGTWCQNCPNAEKALHKFKEEMGNRLSYLEMHIGDPLAISSNSELATYYEATSLPLAIINGNLISIITSSPEDCLQDYKNKFNPILQQKPKAVIKDLTFLDIKNNKVEAEVFIDINSDAYNNNLYLYYSLVEIEDKEYQNHNGVNLAQVLKTFDKKPITNLDNKVNLSIETKELKEDYILVVWLEKTEENFNNNEIYNVIEALIPQN